MNNLSLIFAATVAVISSPHLWAQAPKSSAAFPYETIHTHREAAAALSAARVLSYYPSNEPRANGVIDMVENVIRKANRSSPETLRQPVSIMDIKRLRSDFSRRGYRFSISDVQSMVDVAHVYFRESPGRSLKDKIANGLEKPGRNDKLHGLAAEFAEAGCRGMILTKNNKSQTFDLTEARPRPRNLQLKIYKDEKMNIHAALADLARAPGKARYAAIPQAALDYGESRGLLKYHVYNQAIVYTPTGGNKSKLIPLNFAKSHQASVEYAQRGRQVLEHVYRPSSHLHYRISGAANIGLSVWSMHAALGPLRDDFASFPMSAGSSERGILALGEHGAQFGAGAAWFVAGTLETSGAFSRAVASSSRLATIGKTAGGIGWAALAISEGFSVARWHRGYVTNREFYSGQAELIVGLGGAVAVGAAGYWGGAQIGGAVGAWFGPAGIPVGVGIGAIVGGIGGGITGSWAGSTAAGYAASRYFKLEDKEQDKKLVEFLKEHYGRSP